MSMCGQFIIFTATKVRFLKVTLITKISNKLEI